MQQLKGCKPGPLLKTMATHAQADMVNQYSQIPKLVTTSSDRSNLPRSFSSSELESVFIIIVIIIVISDSYGVCGSGMLQEP